MKREIDRTGGLCLVLCCPAPTAQNHRRLCAGHWLRWLESTEAGRYLRGGSAQTLLAEFCRRSEAEDRNAAAVAP